MEAKTILLAEDNYVNQQVASGILKTYGHQVDVAGNGDEAVDLVKKSSYDIIFMDIQMPYKDGIAATEEIRSLGILVPIIAITAHNQEEERQRCLDAGMNDYVTKPFFPDDLIQMIERYAHKEQQPQQEGSVNQKAHIIRPEPDTPIYSERELYERALGDESLIQELIDNFVDETPDQLEALREAIANHDTFQLRHILHRLRGTSGTMSAKRIQALLLAVRPVFEKTGDIKIKSHEILLNELATELEKEFDLFRKAVEQKAFR
jgi:two-component system, sensor histidine kinase and response regulator